MSDCIYEIDTSIKRFRFMNQLQAEQCAEAFVWMDNEYKYLECRFSDNFNSNIIKKIDKCILDKNKKYCMIVTYKELLYDSLTYSYYAANISTIDFYNDKELLKKDYEKYSIEKCYNVKEKYVFDIPNKRKIAHWDDTEIEMERRINETRFLRTI